jgi:hypothetical protein
MLIEQHGKMTSLSNAVTNQVDVSPSDIESVLMVKLNRQINSIEQEMSVLLRVVQDKNIQIKNLSSEIDILVRRLDVTENLSSSEAIMLRTRIDGLKHHVTELAGAQQMDLIRLQTLSSKRNGIFDMLSALLKKIAESKNTMVAKIG